VVRRSGATGSDRAAGSAEEKAEEGVGRWEEEEKGSADRWGRAARERKGRGELGGKEKRAGWTTGKKWAAPGEKETGPRKGRVGPRFRKGKRWAGLAGGLGCLLFSFSFLLFYTFPNFQLKPFEFKRDVNSNLTIQTNKNSCTSMNAQTC
jgi:hypothetical protein